MSDFHGFKNLIIADHLKTVSLEKYEMFYHYWAKLIFLSTLADKLVEYESAWWNAKESIMYYTN